MEKVTNKMSDDISVEISGKIKNRIESLESLAIDLETKLCAIPAISPDSGGEGEIDKCVFLESWLVKQGITGLQRFDAPDDRAKGKVRPNLIATVKGTESGGCLWIMSHMDVVPPGEISLWKNDPWKAVAGEKNGKKCLIGRGVEDNQQGLVSSVLAVLALAGEGLKPKRTVKLLFVSDEENGSAYGIGWLMKAHPELFNADDIALVPDAGDEYGSSIEVAEKNIAWARFVTHGRQAHGSRPDQGVNAHLAGADLAVRLHYGLTKKFGDHDPLFDPDFSTFEPTKKEANVPNVNTIPGEDVIYFDMRILPRYPIAEVLRETDRIIGEIQTLHGVKIDYTLSQAMESKPTRPDSPLIKKLTKNIEAVYNVKAKSIGIGGGTVAAFMRNSGMDAAVWCTETKSAHQPNEYALIANILGDAKIMALMMLEDF
ncbi:MAG: M20 family metallo-hydrolase [Treponema sp.]|nr:M20 family metallo-hydrolase [Treponema sp.]